MNNRAVRVVSSLAVFALLAACGHSANVIPRDTHASLSDHGRHVRDVVAGLTVIGHTTSVNSFAAIYAAAGMGDPGGGIQEVVDLGSIHDRNGGVPLPTLSCDDPNDQCQVAACDPTDPDCVVQIAELGGPAKAGDTCGPNSKPVGGPVTAASPNGTVERITDIKFIVMDFAYAKVPAGYVYVSDQGHNYFQPNASFGVGAGAIITGSAATVEPPYVPMGNITASNLAAAFNAALDASKRLGFVVNPAAYNIIKSGKVGSAGCFSSPHSATWA